MAAASTAFLLTCSVMIVVVIGAGDEHGVWVKWMVVAFFPLLVVFWLLIAWIT